MSKTFYEIWSHTWNESQANGADLFIPVTGSNYVADLLQLDTSHKWVVGSMRIAGLKIPLTPMRTNELVRVSTGKYQFPGSSARTGSLLPVASRNCATVGGHCELYG